MSDVDPPCRPERVQTCLHAKLVGDDAVHPVTLLEISSGGFSCEGAGLEKVPRTFRLVASFGGGAEPCWSPKARAVGSRGLGPPLDVPFEAEAQLIALDTRRRRSETDLVRLHARFSALDAPTRSALESFIGREARRRRATETLGPPRLASL